MAETDHSAYEADFSDLYERALPPARARELEDHLASCERCRAEYDKLKETIGALSGLHKMAAPQHFDAQVAQTINRRSAGRFFGRKAFGDRVPFEALAILALVVAVAVYLMFRFSTTGAVHEPLEKAPRAGERAPSDQARDVMPKP